jgi:hypothetical protein
MKVAFALYGQPRDYQTGYNNITNFISKHKDIEFDFFYHCWTLEKNNTYPVSPWRNYSHEEVSYKENVINKLEELYKPILSESELQITNFDEKIYTNTIAYTNTIQNTILYKNINNILSQLYSRNKVRNMINKHILDTNSKYDFIIMCRFDYHKNNDILLNELDITKVYVSGANYPRKIIHDNFLIIPTDIFIKWFNIYENLHNILNNNDLLNIIKEFNENIAINAEELIFANYLFHYKNLENIKYVSSIKDGV